MRTASAPRSQQHNQGYGNKNSVTQFEQFGCEQQYPWWPPRRTFRPSLMLSRRGRMSASAADGVVAAIEMDAKVEEIKLSE